VKDPPIDHEGTLVAVPSVALPGRGEYRIALGMSPENRRRLAAFGPTLVHLATPDLLGIQGLRYARRHGIPVLTSYHTHFSSYLRFYRLQAFEPLLWRYLRWFYSKCDSMYAPSESMAELLHDHGIDRDMGLWERGIELSQFNPRLRSMQWRRSHGVHDDEVLVTWVSRLVVEKGVDVFAATIERLTQLGIPHRSMMVGDGPVIDELRERLPDTIFTGHMEHDALPVVYASSDVFVFPSETETFGNVTLEAMASGLPCVCANATGSASLVEHGVTGLLVPPGYVDGFAHSVRRLIEDDALRLRMGRAGSQRAAMYDWDVILGQMSANYDALLDARFSDVDTNIVS
jgi:glycosyltransferase involved in cell wall biosynthesis